MIQNENDAADQRGPRFWLAMAVLAISILAIAALAAIILLQDKTVDTSKYVLGVTLPLLGTWVGTILAFYFSRENFESASRSVREMAKQMTPMEKLASVPVSSKMIRRSEMVLLSATADRPLPKLSVYTDLLGTLQSKERNRLPILDENGYPKYMIHRSMIDQYLAGKSVEGGLSSEQLKQLTLGDLLSDRADLKKLFETSFAVVGQAATLADAKRAMDAVEACLDVLVTPNGTRNEQVIGWLTNLIITESAKV